MLKQMRQQEKSERRVQDNLRQMTSTVPLGSCLILGENANQVKSKAPVAVFVQLSRFLRMCTSAACVDPRSHR